MQITKLLSLLLISSILFTACSTEDDSPAFSEAQMANKKGVGTSANDLLSDINYKGITLEIVSVKGAEPTIEAINGLRKFLTDRLHKPDGITIKQRTVASSNLAPFTIEEIAQIENNTRTSYNTGDEISVYIYFADGKNEKDTATKKTLGTAYLNTSIVIYEDTLKELSNTINAPTLPIIETAALHHEFAHLLGLVNVGTPTVTPHEDLTAKGHCNISGCLMGATIEFGNSMMSILGNGIPSLDPQCIADLQANGGK
ncbi:hypothetical protein ACFSTE_09800 [Aquimarina hainanensis]|uniref:Membrane metalloprotease n=1 Tax=Aquimarina hainanensis TaxID=1578017 RepID=A0ABW5N837_9FLAO